MQALRYFFLTVVASALVLLPAPAHAQAKCSEGKTASGTCVDGALAGEMRQGVRVYTQPRLSYSGNPVLPKADHQYDVLRDWRQGLRLETLGPCGSALPRSCP